MHPPRSLSSSSHVIDLGVGVGWRWVVLVRWVIEQRHYWDDECDLMMMVVCMEWIMSSDVGCWKKNLVVAVVMVMVMVVQSW